MKNTLLYITLLTTCFTFAQNWTTNTVTLDAGDNYTVKFDVDTFTNTVTMTMVGNQNVWLGVAPGVSEGNGMGNAGDDVIVYTSAGLEDRQMPAGTGTPSADASNDWTLVSDNTSGGVVTVIATRARDTGNSGDFVFPITKPSSLPILWAHGNGSTAFGYHGFGNKSGVVATNITLSTSNFELQTAMDFFPNPVKNILTVNLSGLYDNSLIINVFDVLGKKIKSKNITSNHTVLNMEDLKGGLYLITLSSQSSGESVTKKFVKL